MHNKLMIRISRHVVRVLGLPGHGVPAAIKKEPAITYFQRGMEPFGETCLLANLSVWDFMAALHERRVFALARWSNPQQGKNVILANGMIFEKVLKEYLALTLEDIRAVIAYGMERSGEGFVEFQISSHSSSEL